MLALLTSEVDHDQPKDVLTHKHLFYDGDELDSQSL